MFTLPEKVSLQLSSEQSVASALTKDDETKETHALSHEHNNTPRRANNLLVSTGSLGELTTEGKRYCYGILSK